MGRRGLPRPCGGAAFNINTLLFQTHQFKGTRSSCALFFPPALFCLSPALDAIIALLMRRHMGDIWSLPARQKTRSGHRCLCVAVRACLCVQA